MPEQVPFVNRQEELTQISQLIGDWGTSQVLFIGGDGGIGKTRILDEIQRRFAGASGTPVLVADTVDFDDITFQLPENVEQQIAQRLDERAFDPYLRALHDWRKMEAAGVSAETLEEQGRRVLDNWVENFNQVTAKRRVVLRFDTVEKAEAEVWERLQSMITRGCNAVFILAGRNTGTLLESWQSAPGQVTSFIHLMPFATAAGEEYLEGKQRLLHVSVEAELARKLLLLAEGRPILIDLAVEWLARNLPFDWITTSTLEEIQSLAEEDLELRRKEFESQLVHPITQIRSPMDRLTLAMSHVYPLTIPMIAQLLNLAQSEAAELFDEAKTYVFVKQVAKDRLSLHDVMRDMVNVYVWPEVDERKDRRRLYSHLAAEFFRREIEQLLARTSQLATVQEEARQAGDTVVELEAFIERETKERELWTSREQVVFHSLFSNVHEGVETFSQVFDEAANVNQRSVQRLLLDQVKGFEAEFSSIERYEVKIRQVVYLLKTHKTYEAKSLLDRLMSEYADGDRRELDMLTRLARYSQSTGNLKDAVTYLEQALAICRADPHLLKSWGGVVLNGLGWMNRLMGKWHQSADFYRQGIELIGETGNEAVLAAAYNNLGYVDGLQKNYDSALVYCQRALRMQKELGLEYESGRTHNAIGIIYRGKHDYLKSLKHTDQALSIFLEFDDNVWTARAYCERGITRWHMGELAEANRDLDLSFEIADRMGISSELVNILHGKGHVAWELGDLETAETYFSKSAEMGKRVSDPRQTVNSLEGLVELYYDMGYAFHQQGDLETRDKWYTKSQETAAQWKADYEDQGYDFPLYSGDRIRTLANIAYDHGDFKTALMGYLEAYLRTASPWGYSRQTLPERLGWLQERIDQLPPKLALKWCSEIEKHWKKHRLAKDYPEMITVCEVGRDNAKRRAAIHQGGEN